MEQLHALELHIYFLHEPLTDLFIRQICITGTDVSDYNAYMTTDPRMANSIQARSHTFVEIDNEIISTVILFPSADSFKKCCCQLQAKVCAQSTG